MVVLGMVTVGVVGAISVIIDAAKDDFWLE
jgi:hypothetical protein